MAWMSPPNMRDYEAARNAFSWADVRGRLDGLPGGRGLNIAHEAVDRHALGPLATRTRCDGSAGPATAATSRTRTFAPKPAASRMCSAHLGVGNGEVVATLSGRIPALYIAALGTLKNGSVFTPLFSAFGPDPIAARMTLSHARVLVTTDTLYHRKVEPIRAQLPDLEHVLLVGEGSAPLPARTLDLSALMSRHRPISRFPRPIRRRRRCSISPAARQASRKARCTCTTRSSHITRRRGSRSTSIRTIASGARPIRAG